MDEVVQMSKWFSRQQRSEEKSRLKIWIPGHTEGIYNDSIYEVTRETAKAEKRRGLGTPTFKGVEN